jgi:tRNA pseudouridine38-40 synthase
MRRVAVKIAYLGHGFTGSQIQPGVRTVEGDVISDLKKISDMGADETDLKSASRTDRGVNALGNVIVFNTPFENNDELLRALNAVSDRIFYRSIATVGDDFNPRHANERIYRYILPRKGIDIGLAEQCASLFIGEHDLVRFCKADGRSTVMDMRSISIEEDDDVLVIEFRAEYFLWNVIRRVVAALSSVGTGKTSLDDVEKAVNGSSVSFGMARPDALTLVDVVYDHVDFISADTFSNRKEEELFILNIRKKFFGSL